MAEYDLETARVMLSGKRYLYVGFMCHQVIEKALKGYYVFIKKETPPYTHNLTSLGQKANIYEVFSDEQKDILDMLDPLNIEARYPTHKEKIIKLLDQDKCLKILQ